ncbi:amino acid/amide ABC transporter membrane protein 1, HAAT family [Devosia sp. YR412]|uniref:urea ABC transporter permease subunit UrtB n=1 Tax=Devosia sp. YR412 TaxID=1881030 RepID=UPI0008BFFD24|nr:urea ABC transporter permease subunit UrtB [Devosia sp. YR412]SEQ03653.1 amino acid/amide ABC transporter membrane protein 1, HAAT family [Devosia sp. YR412]
MNAILFLQRIALFLVLTLGLAVPAQAQIADADLLPLVDALAPGNFKDREGAIGVLVTTGDQRVVPILEVLLEGELYFDDATGKVVFTSAPSGKGTISDPVTGAELPTLTEDGLEKVKVNNGLRRVLRTAIGQMTLLSEDAGVRRFAAQSILRDADPAQLELLDSAIAAETDDDIQLIMQRARAVIMLKTPEASIEEKTAAVPIAQAIGGRDALNILTTALAGAPAELQPTIQSAIDGLARDRAVWDVAQNVWFGISLGSVLLLAAIGLAITFGVMGVINMAHGEMVMLGAYTTFVVQEIIRQNFPGLFDWSLAIALPLAFLVTGLIGIAIERGIIRFLYGRPLETLLATWGLSLIIQQAVQRIFTANIREVGNPSWMSGSFELGGLAITWNRFYIVIFAIMVFLTLLCVLKYTAIGLHMRAVTQNRRMASSMGIRTPLVDAMTFGLGSGIAGLAGVALSQIGNVSPNLGQGYIIDSFMVVVFGGVGNLWGTLVGALTLGIANKFIEPYAGAVLGKIIILVLIILFIQRRPRGLFALKGRSIEA